MRKRDCVYVRFGNVFRCALSRNRSIYRSANQSRTMSSRCKSKLSSRETLLFSISLNFDERQRERERKRGRREGGETEIAVNREIKSSRRKVRHRQMTIIISSMRMRARALISVYGGRGEADGGVRMQH